MSNVTIFKPGSAIVGERRELTDLDKSFTKNGTSRRIQTNTNGTFKRIVNGEQIGNAVRGEVNVIIVNFLSEVSRVFYEAAYDPDAKATLPDCWSNLGVVPEDAAQNKQAATCATCDQNIAGSGKGTSKACRFQRRIAVLLEGDPSGDIYQLNIPAKSLFGKGEGNTHPFESYRKFLAANGYGLNTVVTTVSYNLNADSMELQFTAIRNTSDEEHELMLTAQAHSDAQRYVQLTVAQTDGVTAKPAALVSKPAVHVEPVASKSSFFSDDDDAPVDKPEVKRRKTATAAVEPGNLSKTIAEWGDDD